jgi:acyl-[acyl-carrier-protein]-phospholipid O-acyltransferase/long-chain-fatty-acid--[acyl-carrier-protein] ligase
MAYAQAEGFPELWIPRSILVAGIPVLGSGKADYAAASEMVRKLRGML